MPRSPARATQADIARAISLFTMEEAAVQLRVSRRFRERWGLPGTPQIAATCPKVTLRPAEYHRVALPTVLSWPSPRAHAT